MIHIEVRVHKQFVERGLRKRVNAQNLKCSVKSSRKFQFLVKDGYYQINNHRNPYLCFDCVDTVSIEVANSQMLFYPSEKQFDLPSHPVKFWDHDGILVEQVGQIHINLSFLWIAISDAPKWPWIGRATFRRTKKSDLIAAQSYCRVHYTRTLPIEHRILLRPDYKEGSGLMDACQAFEVEIAPIHQVDAPGFEKQRIQPSYIVFAGLGDMDTCGDGATKIDLSMQFDPGLGLSEGCPRKESQGEVDGRRVQCIHAVVQIDIQLFSFVKLTCFADQPLGDTFPNSPISGFVGIGQGGLRQRPGEAQMVQSFGLGVEAIDDISKPFPPCQLRESHCDELLATPKVLHFVIATELLDLPIEGFPVNLSSDLRYDICTCSHGLAYIEQDSQSKASHQYFALINLAA